MNQKDNKPFQWTDELVKKFANDLFIDKMADDKAIADFKSSHSASSSGNDWEVLAYFIEMNATILEKNKNGTFGPYDAKESDIKTSSLFSIHSVRRLSDGEVFSIGDWCDTVIPGKIEDIRVDGKHCTVGGKNWGCPLSRAEKAPIPEEKPVLFTTEDGKEVLKDSTVWCVSRDCSRIKEWIATKIPEPLDGSFIYFSSQELANEYVTMNKPCLSIKDIQSAYGDDRGFVGTQFLVEKLKQLASSKIQGGKE